MAGPGLDTAQTPAPPAAERTTAGLDRAQTPAPPAANTPTPLAVETPAQTVVGIPAQPPPIDGYEVVAIYPHDPGAFTQGLVIEGTSLIEGTGLYGQSSLRRVDLATGQVLQYLALPAEVFGEGITRYGDRIYQLTWREGTGYIYDRDTFQLLKTFTYPTEGWGITHDGQRLIVSDGSATLYFWDPKTLAEIGRLEVRDSNGPVGLLNELEFIKGEIWANVWQTDLIARIDPEKGVVLGWIDLGGLLGPEDRQQPVDVLNGIAYDEESDRLFVTGKWWPKLFEIVIVPAGG